MFNSNLFRVRLILDGILVNFQVIPNGLLHLISADFNRNLNDISIRFANILIPFHLILKGM